MPSSYLRPLPLGAALAVRRRFAGAAPSAFEVGLIHSLHEVTLTLVRLVKELQAHRGVQQP